MLIVCRCQYRAVTMTMMPTNACSATQTVHTITTGTPGRWGYRPLSIGSPATAVLRRLQLPRSNVMASRLEVASTPATVLTPVGLLETEKTSRTVRRRCHRYTMVTCGRKVTYCPWTKTTTCSPSRPTPPPTWTWSEVLVSVSSRSHLIARSFIIVIVINEYIENRILI